MDDDQERKAKEVEQGLLGFLCPRRSEGLGYPGMPSRDVWRQVGLDRCCSYCGSMHPEDLRALLPSVDGESVDLSVADTKYGYVHKIYIRRLGIRNASEGAIKFYVKHGPPNSDSAFWDLLNEKVELCKRKLMEMMRR